MRRIGYLIISVALLLASLAIAAPKPAVVQKPGEWTFDVEFEHLQQIKLSFRQEQKPRYYWYTILTLTNETGKDVGFYPACDLMTDTFQIIPSGKNVPPVVVQRIKKRHRKSYPFLQSVHKTGSRILQGKDQAKDVLIVWPDFDFSADHLSLFISGLSNETAVIDHPSETNPQGDPKKVFLRKTLELEYNIEGDPTLRSQVKVSYAGKRWVMR